MRARLAAVVLCLAASAPHYAGAQQVATTAAAVTYDGFSTKVAAFSKALEKDKTHDAEMLFNDINRMANAEMGSTRDKMRQATGEADRAKYRQLAINQRTLFADALRLKQQDMAANRAAIVAKLDEFAATLH